MDILLQIMARGAKRGKRGWCVMVYSIGGGIVSSEHNLCVGGSCEGLLNVTVDYFSRIGRYICIVLCDGRHILI